MPCLAGAAAHQKRSQGRQRQGGQFQRHVDGYQLGGGGQQHHARCREEEQAEIFPLESGHQPHVFGGGQNHQRSRPGNQEVEEQCEAVNRQAAQQYAGLSASFSVSHQIGRQPRS